MRFGGHETFALREGWLHKGLKLLGQDPVKLGTDAAQDELGVGRNMVKSIRHWLLATGTAMRPIDRSTSKPGGGLVLSPLGSLILERDPYLLEPGTWWFLHTNLVHSREHAYSWWWFFNYFNRDRFERSVCVEGLRRYLQINEARSPGARTQQRDIACLLATYARTYPSLHTDPEDGAECPFIELGLLDHFRESGTFRVNPSSPEAFPPEVLCYAIAKKAAADHAPDNFIEMTVRVAAAQECSPGKVLRLGPEIIHEMAIGAESLLEKQDISVVSLAGERVIKLRSLEAVEWAHRYYERESSQASCAA